MLYKFHCFSLLRVVLAVVGGFVFCTNDAQAAADANDNADNYNSGNYSQSGQANLGMGFGAWSQTNNGQGYYGTFLSQNGSESQINGPNGNAFDAYAGAGGTFSITRPFTADSTTNSASLAIGQTFSISLDPRGIQTGTTDNGATYDSVGYQLGSRFSFGFRGGEGDFYYQDATGRHDSGIGFTSGGLITALTLNTVDTYTLTVTRQAYGQTPSAVFTFMGTLNGMAGSGISSVTVFDYNAGDNNDVYFNALSITDASPVPEPGTICGGLFVTGVLAAHLKRRRQSDFTPGTLPG